jgi:hypothetical protein
MTASSSNIPAGMGADHPQPSRFRPTANPSKAPPPVPLGADLSDVLMPESGYPDAYEAGLVYAAGQRAQARAVENRGSLSTTPGDTSTPTMYPSAYGAGYGGGSAAPPSTTAPGTVADVHATNNKNAKKDKKKNRRASRLAATWARLRREARHGHV